PSTASGSTPILARRRWRNSRERKENAGRVHCLPGIPFFGEQNMKNANGKFLGAKTKLILAVVGIPVLIGAWWAFRPEKLFINQQVSEAAPAGVGAEAEPLYTGKLESREHPTNGRTTIYTGAGGKKYLRLTDFATSNGPDVHV